MIEDSLIFFSRSTFTPKNMKILHASIVLCLTKFILHTTTTKRKKTGKPFHDCLKRFTTNYLSILKGTPIDIDLIAPLRVLGYYEVTRVI